MKKIKNFLIRQKLYPIGLVVICIVIFVGQKVLNTDSTSTVEEQSIYSTVKKGSIVSSIAASGTIESANYLPITTSVNGIVEKVYVIEGEVVIKGQKIMDINLSSDGEESLSQAWASYLSAKNSVEKAKTDLKSKESSMINAEEAFQYEKEHNSYQTHDERVSYTLAENAYQIAKDNYDQQGSSIAQAESSLSKAWLAYQAQSPTVVAPDSGTIANILVVEGMDISNSLSERTSSSVAAIKKEGAPIASLNISELDINSIVVGQKVILTLDSIDNKEFTGKVVGIDKIGSVSNNIASYTVMIRFDESSDLVLPNMGVEAEIILEEKADVLTVPVSAVTSENKQKTVIFFKDGVKESVHVETGISDGKNIEIISGLNEGDQIVLSSLPTSGFSEAQNSNNSNTMRGAGSFLR